MRYFCIVFNSCMIKTKNYKLIRAIKNENQTKDAFASMCLAVSVVELYGHALVHGKEYVSGTRELYLARGQEVL